MKQTLLKLLTGILCFSTVGTFASYADEKQTGRFQDVLTLAGIGSEQLKKLPATDEFTASDWQVVTQVISRLKQFSELPPTSSESLVPPVAWTQVEAIGEIYEVRGTITELEQRTLPKSIVRLSNEDAIYVCRFIFNDEDQAITILSSHVPDAWRAKDALKEPVRIRGVLAKTPSNESSAGGLLIAERLAWYPVSDAPSGQILLAKHGMDVALLDEVKQRQPFVKAEVSREGEAFYAGLTSLSHANNADIMSLAASNVKHVAEEWQLRGKQLQDEYRAKQQLLTSVNKSQLADAQRELRRSKTRRDLSITVARQAQNGQSSVAPMFLQPEKEVGELYLFEGTARRAVWIAAEGEAELTGYYELEVYPIESRLLDNRPVVCCMTSLPQDFPTGDAIREPVRVAGVFFKSWRYRSRDLVTPEGQTEQQRQLYTPVLLGKEPSWLRVPTNQSNPLAVWGGFTFLALLGMLWIGMTWLTRRDREARRALRPAENISISSDPS